MTKKSSKKLSNVDVDKLNFPDLSGMKDHQVTFQEIILLSEELLPITNKRRKKSPAAQYTPFKLK